MPKPSEVAEILVRGQRYRNWQTVSVARSGVDPFPKAVFTAASPVESGTNWAGMKLAIGDPCEVILGDVKAITGGRIVGRNPAYDANQHGLQLSVTTDSAVIARASVDHERGEYKGSSLSQIANALLKPYGKTFSLKGDTSGMDKPFDKFNVQAGETVFAAIERLCRMRNVYILGDIAGNLVGYRLDSATKTIADLQEGRNILSASASFDYTGAFNKIDALGQKPGNDQTFGDDARDVKGTVTNPQVKQHAPLTFMMEQPGDQADARMRAQHENGFLLSNQVLVTVNVQGWFASDTKLWLEHIGDAVSVYSPMLFTDDRMNLAIQAVTSTQGPQGTLSSIALVLPEAFNGTAQIDSGGLPPKIYEGAT